jgi:hypothetical protein
MKPGDLIKLKDGKAGLIIRETQKKFWVREVGGININWDNVTEEPHVEIMFTHSPAALMEIPVRLLLAELREVIPCTAEI